MNGNTIRFFTVMCCAIDVGICALLYARVGRFLLPHLWMRLLMAGNIILLIAAGCGAYARLGDPLTWRSPSYLAGAALELAGFVGLYHWYGTARGETHSQKMRRD